VLKNPPGPGSGPLFGSNGTVFEASETDLSPFTGLQPTFSTGSRFLGN
jgi:hypothetical protein